MVAIFFLRFFVCIKIITIGQHLSQHASAAPLTHSFILNFCSRQCTRVDVSFRKRVTHLQSNKSLRLCHDNVHKNVGSPFTCDMTHSHMLYHSHDFGELLPRILALTPSHHMVSNKAAQTLTTDYVFHSHSVQHEPLTYHLACVGMLYEYFSVSRMPLPHISKRHINSECETISQAHTHYTQTPHVQDDGPQETRRETKRQ